MESFMRRGRQWGRVVSVLFSLLALARARQQSEVESDLLGLGVDIYTGGPFSVIPLHVSKGHNGAPLKLLIAAPGAPGEYPVVQFQHGFQMENNYYSQLLIHVASYGFIVVAPQMEIPFFDIFKTNATDEIRAAASVIDWLQTGLNQTLSQSVKPELDKLAVVGHSRGGKVVFGLATGACGTSPKLSAIVGLGPVDGTETGHTEPPILKDSPHDLNLSIPTLIVGAGLAEKQKFFRLWPICAPDGVSHQQFFKESAAPAFHFVAPKYGHMDFLNGECSWWAKHCIPFSQNLKTCCPCKNGPDMERMRNFSAGITVAFLEAYLNNNASPFNDAFTTHSQAPVQYTSEKYGPLPGSFAAQEFT